MQEPRLRAKVAAKRVATIKSKTYSQLEKKTLAKLEVDLSDGEGERKGG
jgi:U3 small nucleolar RNA-associated protein 14